MVQAQKNIDNHVKAEMRLSELLKQLDADNVPYTIDAKFYLDHEKIEEEVINGLSASGFKADTSNGSIVKGFLFEITPTTKDTVLSSLRLTVPIDIYADQIYLKLENEKPVEILVNRTNGTLDLISLDIVQKSVNGQLSERLSYLQNAVKKANLLRREGMVTE
ncbi:MAG: hypothetical protein KGH60_04310 [Candidatus Micrarchaeota archaeon]|nr:hypothetical protein [Candidatus Micrarchaeota archaeon]